jgi:hypothetical protein
MLFLVSEKGVPSLARWIRVLPEAVAPGDDDGPPWAPALLAVLSAGALGGGAYRLARRRRD